MKFLHVAAGGVARWLNRCDDVVERLLFCGSLGAMSLSSPECLVVVGEDPERGSNHFKVKPPSVGRIFLRRSPRAWVESL
jgi:hypothetical protein